MAEETKKLLRAALDRVIEEERNRVHQILDESDQDIARRIEKIQPIIAALNELSEEIGLHEGLRISPALAGHQVTVETKSSTGSDRYTITTNIGNTSMK